MKKLIACLVFLLSAFLGSMAVGGGFGRIGTIGMVLIVIVSFNLMWYAIGMWKDSTKSKGTVDDPIDTGTKDAQE